MDWWTFVICALMFVGAFAVIGEVVALGAVIGLGYQAMQWVQTGRWPSYTLASELSIPTNFQPTHWVIVDRLIHYVLFDVEAAFVVLICVGLMMPVKEWLERSPAPVKRAVKPLAGSSVPTYSGRAPVPSPATGHPLTSPELGMAGRLGVFLGWLFTAVAVLCAALALLVLVNKGEPVFGWVALAVGGAVWLFGRGVRYVLAGPTVPKGPPEGPTERFPVPRVPVRVPSSPPWGERP